MPAFSQRTRFELGDEVSNGVRTGMVVWSDFPSKRTGAHFLVVKSHGLLGKKPFAAYPWRPLLDYDDGTNKYRCTSCDREYRAGASKGWCRQCVRKDEREHNRQGTTMARPGGRKFASNGTGHEILPAPAPPDRDSDLPF